MCEGATSAGSVMCRPRWLLQLTLHLFLLLIFLVSWWLLWLPRRPCWSAASPLRTVLRSGDVCVPCCDDWLRAGCARFFALSGLGSGQCQGQKGPQVIRRNSEKPRTRRAWRCTETGPGPRETATPSVWCQRGPWLASVASTMCKGCLCQPQGRGDTGEPTASRGPQTLWAASQNCLVAPRRRPDKRWVILHQLYGCPCSCDLTSCAGRYSLLC
mmetsp:Transcript_15638/g.34483  ORF Transcript_15638/g.34483 Transcript_15638/m.34483 type:complete len:214 (+) Transcript_15638:242-883(+)